MVEGLLYSQVGYDIGLPMRAAVCGARQRLGDRPAFVVRAADGEVAARGTMSHWGERWGREWWVADLGGLGEGRYRLETFASDGTLFREGEIEVGRGLLWERTFRHVALEQARKRAIFANAKVGWFDAGMHWQEANSHAAFVIGLSDVLEFAGERIGQAEREWVEKQVMNGCDYLALCQKRAAELGKAAGSLVHETPKWESVVLASDASKAAVAWARAARLLTGDAAKAKGYLACAEAAYGYAMSARPSRIGFSRVARGLEESFAVPEQWTTRELFMQAWAAMELALAGLGHYRDDFAAVVAVIRQRQVGKECAEGELYGHFYEFAGGSYSEKTWTHSLENGEWGVDVGATFSNWVVPLIRACEIWPEHGSAREWREMIERYAYGYFLPACRANPFLIMPQGWFAGEGLLNFAGLWHGMNAVYGLAAAVGVELSRFLRDRSFVEIAVGNMQWIAGLNVGVTRESLEGCVMFDMDIAEGEALPASMIFGVGQRCAGGWTTMRGSICNGFATGAQFKFDVRPTLANDAKITLTDEDWITHCGGWLSGLSRLATLEDC